MIDNYPLAQEALAHGWCVFPCKADKQPAIKSAHPEGDPLHGKCHGECGKEGHGFYDATHDPQKVFDFWETYPDALVGIPCEINNIWALDLDRKNGTDGIAELQRIAKEHGADHVDAGPMQTTPSGGLHLIFKLGAWDIPQSASKVAPGVDVRSAGYICTGALPDGRAYVWNSAEGHGIDAPLTEAPAWLLDVVGAYKFDTSKINTAKELQKPLTNHKGSIDFWLDKFITLAKIGQRNENGFNLACQVRDAGYSQAECEALEYPERVPQGQDVYDRAEWLATVKSAYARTPREPAKKQGGAIAADPPEPEAPPEVSVQAQQSEPEQSTTKENGDEWIDPWQDAWQTLSDAFAPRPPVEYAVENLIRLPSLIAWYGNPGDLKTFLLQYVFLCIAAGKPCFPEAPWKSGGRVFPVHPYPVLWLDFDNGEDLTKERFEALARAMGIDPALPNLHYVSMPSPWLVLGDPKSAGHLTRQIQKFGARALGIDNLGTTKGGAKENTDEMIPVMSNLRQVVETTRAGISVIHHETKSGAMTARRGDSLRGHSSIEAAIDLALLVSREPNSDIVTIQSTKTRGTPIDSFSAAFTYAHKTGTKELETAMFYALPCENDKSPQSIKAAIKEALADNPMLKTALAKQIYDIVKGIGINVIRNYIDQMIAAAEIITTPGGKTTGILCALP
jgi:hypothetical protein